MADRLYRGLKPDSVWGVGQNEWQAAYEGLASAIILQALKDYVGRNFGQHNMSGKELHMSDAENFLRSKYFEFLCVSINVKGKEIIDHVDENGLPMIHISTIIDGWVEDEKSRHTRNERNKKAALNRKASR